ncbi:hypothetical protein AA0488_1072 [Kozakia baliensis NRIC 0488]|nr:hypothetical protein AA0488_1072 [Kozakia baliensis NRIC 0488]GEL64094.1 hypothetical protein KBA01_13800 [Kozakia baliensis]
MFGVERKQGQHDAHANGVDRNDGEKGGNDFGIEACVGRDHAGSVVSLAECRMIAVARFVPSCGNDDMAN